MVAGVCLHQRGGGGAGGVEVAVAGEPAPPAGALHDLVVVVAVKGVGVSSHGTDASGAGGPRSDPGLSDIMGPREHRQRRDWIREAHRGEPVGAGRGGVASLGQAHCDVCGGLVRAAHEETAGGAAEGGHGSCAGDLDSISSCEGAPCSSDLGEEASDDGGAGHQAVVLGEGGKIQL